MAAQEIKVPDIGDFDAVEVIEVLVSEGDTVEEEQALITLESDKATLEVPSTVAGKITDLKVAEGDKVSEGDVIAMIEAGDDAGDDSDDADDDDQADDDSEDAADEDDTGESDEADDSDDDDAADEQEASGGGETVEIKVPDIGDFDEVEVIEVLVAEGDDVAEEQALITLESDKATLEVPSTTAGKIGELKVKEGDKVSEGDVIAMLETAAKKKSGGKSDDKKAASKKSSDGDRAKKDKPKQDDDSKKDAPAKSADSKPAPSGDSDDSSKLKSIDEDRFNKAHASPSVRRYARQLGADLGRIQGSGRKGRILEDDVQAYVKKALESTQGGGAGTAPAGGGGVPQQPDIDFSQFGEVETVKLERIRKISAKAVHRNWLLIPHVTQFDTADITEMEAFRKANKEKAAKEGVKLTPLAFMLKACAAALKQFPDMNSSLSADGESLIHKKYCNIAVAVDTPAGLLMPVLKDVDQKGIYELARELDGISGRARDGKLKGDEMKGACFSISSLGGVGGTAFTPIVNSPEVAILGVSKHAWQPVWDGNAFVPRLILPLSLSYDHRVIDGAKAARITGFISEKLSDLRTLLL
ncbi:dihydrolipoyllysine-residue acetyltransferase [Salinisphaera aquimarina]|uniref:Acetyltransferase component of pyruvate dehydrogenase complex n=1 Tax=Salinisphaera aquimarina TaxID=2094031 RepID=A0ABV7EQN6_9GAMM